LVRKYLFNHKGNSQLLVFIVLLIPVTLMLSLFMVIGEYWKRSTALDNLNSRLVSTINKKGVTELSGSSYDISDIEDILDTFDEQIYNLLGDAEVTFYGAVNEQNINGFNDEQFKSIIRNYGLGRNDGRQDIVGVRVTGLNPALLDRVLRVSVGWFFYTGENILYKSFIIGEVQPWLE